MTGEWRSRAHPSAAAEPHRARRCQGGEPGSISTTPVWLGVGETHKPFQLGRPQLLAATHLCLVLVSPSDLSPIYLHAKREYRDDNFKHQSQGELPHGCVDSRASRSVRNVIHWSGHVWVVDIVTELWWLQGTTIVEELWDQLTCAPSGVGVGVGDDGSDSCYHYDLQDWVFPKSGSFSPPAPGNVASDKEGPPQATKDSKQDEGEELSHVPRRVVFHIEQDQTAVSKRIDRPQCEGSYESSKKWPPEGFQRKVVADLKQNRGCKHFAECDRGWAGG